MAEDSLGYLVILSWITSGGIWCNLLEETLIRRLAHFELSRVLLIVRLAALVLSLAVVCPGRPLKVVLIDKKGAPLSGQDITLSLLYKQAQQFHETASPTTYKTDQAGVVVFQVPNPLPATVGIRIKLNSPKWDCNCVAIVPTSEVFTTGSVLSPPGKPITSGSLHRQPGSVTVVVFPKSLLYRLLYPIEKE